MPQPILNVTELDFDQIKANLKSYFQRQDSPFRDWDFEGSGLNMFLDVLAYNTHYNALLAHMTINESFIDTAQLRSSVVSQAKLLGYLPRSISAAQAILNGTFVPSLPGATGTLTIPRGTTFTSANNNGSYTFVALTDTTEVLSSSSTYSFMYGNQSVSSATGGTFTTLTDTAQSWTVDAWADYAVYVVSGMGAGNIIPIASNTINTLTFATSVNFTPDSTTSYVIYNPNDSASNTSIVVAQGALKTQTYQVDNTIPNQKFTITDPGADISTLVVRVYDHQNATSYTTFVPFTSFDTTSADSQVYFISQNVQGLYEIQFGNGIIGAALNNLNIVSLEFVSTQGEVANGCSVFTYGGGPSGEELTDSNGSTLASPTITTVAQSIDGAPEESIDSIRFNAPYSLITQNRAVTSNDYKSIILNEFGAVDAINVWGGEDEVTYDPINAARYAGQAYISIKPVGADTLTQPQKDAIATILDGKRVMTIQTNFYDPDYVNIYMDVYFKYTPNKTTLTQAQLQSMVANGTVASYNSTVLQRFDGVFRHSNLLANIDKTDPAILNSDARVYFYKNYVVNVSSSASDVIGGYTAIPNSLITTYGNALDGTADQVASLISSDAFAYAPSSPSGGVIRVTGTTSLNSTSVTITSSPGTTASGVVYSNPFLVVGATITGLGITATGSTITIVTNTGASTVLTITPAATSTASGTTLTVTPPTYANWYLKDGNDPMSATSRGVYASNASTGTVTTSDIRIGTIYPETGKIELFTYYQAKATSGSSSTLVDNAIGTGSSQHVSWATNQFTGNVIHLIAGTGAGQSGTIGTNSSNTITLSSGSFSPPPDSTTTYIIITNTIDTDAKSTIRIFGRPASNDVAPSRHQLLKIDMALTTCQGSIDTVAVAGSPGTNNYTTFTRDRTPGTGN